MKLRRFRKPASVIAAVAMMLGLCSCVSQETGLVFSDDCETVTMYAEASMQKDFLTQMEMTAEDFYSSVDEGASTYKDWEKEDKESTKDDVDYISRRYSKVYTYDELVADEGIRMGGEEDVVSVDYKIEKTAEEIGVTITYTYTGEPVSEEDSVDMGGMDDMGMTNEFRITAPFELIEANGKTESEYSKDTEGSQTVLVWDLAGVSAGTEPELVISAKFAVPKAAFPLVPVIIIAAVVIIAVIIVLVVLNAKKQGGGSADAVAAEEPAGPSIQEKLAQTEAEGAIPVQEPEAGEEKKPEYCEICGMKLNGIDKFCPGCGEKV